MLSPLRYPGGKAKLFHYFSELISRNSFYDYVYCEPYAGGAGLALKLLAHGYVSRIEINDIDPAIASFWRSVLNESDRFSQKVADVGLSIEEWMRQREIYNRGQDNSDFDLGFAAYYLNRTSRSGIIQGSGPIGGYAQKGEWSIDARFNRVSQIAQIKEIQRFKESISVFEKDALDFMSERIDRDRNLVYLDPPYYVKGKNLYKNFYDHNDHVAIRDVLITIPDSRWILSYDHVDPIIDLYADFEPLVYDLQYSAGRVGQGKEVIFSGSSVTLPEVKYMSKAA